MTFQKFRLNGPEDIKSLGIADLQELANEIRYRIIATCLKNGGHLGASLGTVELTLAIHKVFSSPVDSIIWDVGHQAYAHQMICGRWDQFDSLRMKGGISGFLKREASPHDVFGAGHASTALSAALGVAWAKRNQTEWTVALVGDGSLSSGLAFEALNNFRNTPKGPLLVILNDNQMSISENVGALSTALSGTDASSYFNIFGLEYHGPVDGHQLDGLLSTLTQIRSDPSQAVLLHVKTQKGRGYLPAEERPASYHGVSPIQKKPKPSSPKAKSFSEVFGEVICELAATHPQLVAISAAMPEGTGLTEFAKVYPDRFFDVGIAEAHAVTFAAGLVTQGVKPVFAVYSTFLQRAFDSIVHDVALQKLGVVFAIDRAGPVGQDGPTHHGIFDLGFLGIIPGMVLSAPVCQQDLKILFSAACNSDLPWAIRYPRGSGLASMDLIPMGNVKPVGELAELVRIHTRAKVSKAIVVGLGTAGVRLLKAVHQMGENASEITLLTVGQAKPIPESLVREIMENFRNSQNSTLITLEDGSVRGGFGEALVRKIEMDLGLGIRNFIWGYEDHFIEHGSVDELEEMENVSQAALVKRLEAIVGVKAAKT